MRIVRFKRNDQIYYGKLKTKNIYYLEGNIYGDYKVTSKQVKKESVDILSPIEPPNIIGIGSNYKKHAMEINKSYPEKPLIFLKATTSIIGHNSNIILPEVAPNEVDYEGELAVIIGKEAKNIKVEEVDDYIFGYTCANDVSARDCQMRLDDQWARAKSFDTFCPLGPWIETRLSNPNRLNIKTTLNNNVMQNSNTNDLIFNTKKLISYCSKNMTLKPGTVILTGTPGGVGFAKDPQIFLKPGDKISVEIEGIGKLVNIVKKY